MGPLNPTTRLFELLKIPEIGSKRFLVAIDFKTLGRFISLKSGGNHWYWIIRISPEQKEYCGALIVGFLEHPGWQALVPISALKWDGPFSPEKDTYWVAGWRVSAKRKLLNTIPPKLWPYVVPNACLKQALLAWKSYAASTQQTWTNPWTGFVVGDTDQRPDLVSPQVLCSPDEPTFEIIGSLIDAVHHAWPDATIELPRYAPYTSDLKVNGEIIEIKRKQGKIEHMGNIEHMGHGEVRIRHRQRFQGSYNTAPVFTRQGCRWTWLLTEVAAERFLLIHRSRIPQDWFESPDEEVEWQLPLSEMQEDLEITIPVRPTAEQMRTLAQRLQALLNRDHTSLSVLPPPNSRGGDLDGTVDDDEDDLDEEELVSHLPASCFDDNDPDPAQDSSAEDSSASSSDPILHQEVEADRLLRGCAQRRRGLIFPLDPGNRAFREFLLVDYAWSEEDQATFYHFHVPPQQLWELPSASDVITLSFAYLIWGDGLAPSVRDVLYRKLQSRPPRILIFDTRPTESGPLLSPSACVRYLIPSTDIPQKSLSATARTRRVLSLPTPIESYRVSHLDEIYQLVYGLFDIQHRVYTGWKKRPVESRKYVCRLGELRQVTRF